MPAVFELLDRRALLQIHGPLASWESLEYSSYRGPLPFDGISPQLAYSTASIGLVLLSADHLREDIISNRIFEIVSVGAIAICPESRWIRKWFGDAVLYFDAKASPETIAAQITDHYCFCLANPELAQAKADAARSIFEREFSAERMIANAVHYHHQKQQLERDKQPKLLPKPDISVIVRCGGRPLSFVKEAVDSIRNQSFGRFVVILSKYRDIDVSEITSDRSGAISEFREVLTEGGARGATLQAGLKGVRTTYFAVLDDDDFWLSNHVETLFSAAEVSDQEFDVAFSGSVAITADKVQIEKSLHWDRNVYTFGIGPDISSPGHITGGFSSNCFIARAELIPSNPDIFGRFNTAEDSLLVSLVTRRKPPVFSYRATAFFRRGFGGESNWETREDRADDELAGALCTSMQWAPRWITATGMQVPMNEWRRQREIQNARQSAATNAEAPRAEPARRSSIFPLNVTQLLTAGPAGKANRAGFAGIPRTQGHICFGPHLSLEPGLYCAKFRISTFHRWTSRWNRKLHGSIGHVDVCSADGSPLAKQEIFLGINRDVTKALFFVVTGATGKAIEFRVFSEGIADLSVRSITIHLQSGHTSCTAEAARSYVGC